MKTHTITWLEKEPESVSWDEVPAAEVDLFPWYRRGEKQGTRVWVAVSPSHLHVRFDCEDRHISARVTEPNGPVCEDSCVEFFFAPEPDESLAYFNLEINCCGTIHLGYGKGRHGRVMAPFSVIDAIEAKSSIRGFTKQESPKDEGWWVEAKLPFNALRRMAPFPVPEPGTVWRANFYRCGGRTDPQYAVWSPIDWPRPDYHRPEYFGELRVQE